jgi:hypothetical protein
MKFISTSSQFLPLYTKSLMGSASTSVYMVMYCRGRHDEACTTKAERVREAERVRG